MDPRRKLREYGIWFLFVAAGLMIYPPAALSGSDPLSVIYMSFSILCMDSGLLILLCSLAAPAEVARTVLESSLVKQLQRVLAVPLLLELIVGSTPVAAAIDVIVLGFLFGDFAGIWDNYLAFGRLGASVHAYAPTVVESGSSLGSLGVTYEIVEQRNA